MEAVTGDQVKQAALAAGIKRIEHHDCGICGTPVFYFVEDGQLFFSSGCDCSWSPARPYSWQDAADWINMQSREDMRQEIKEQFGFRAEPASQ